MTQLRTFQRCCLTLAVLAVSAGSTALAQNPAPQPEFPPHTQVLAEYDKVVSTTDGKRPMYTLYKHKQEEKLLAELPASFPALKYFLALTVASGDAFAGLQEGDLYFYWRKYGKRLALMSPNIEVRSTGDAESKASVDRLFTDRVILDTQILTMGPTGGPVIDLNSILIGQSSLFFGASGRFSNPSLTTFKTLKAFPDNVEIGIEGPSMGGFDRISGSRSLSGSLRTLHYSISVLKPNPKFKPREADPRIGYFTTSYRDLGKYKDTEIRTRYITRWHLSKRDPSLALSPPEEPIRFVLEHTIPVRYRRWVTEGILHWNKAFEKVGILNAIEVDYQDAQTNRNMELDPEDVRYNFIRWLNNDVATAIGPSRIDPTTGQILDADIILTDGWIRHYYNQFSEILPAVAMEGFNAETLAWLAEHPKWDPRVRLASPSRRNEIVREIQRLALQPLSGHPAGAVNGKLIGNNEYDGLIGRTSQVNGLCLAASGKSLDLAMMSLYLATFDGDNEDDEEKRSEDDKEKKDKDASPEDKKEAAADAKPDDATKNDAKPDEPKKEEPKAEEPKKEEPKKEEPKKPEEPRLDGIPESFIGPLLAELVAHEVGHTLGLRHNFKASSIYTLDEINSAKLKGEKPLAGSVMDYLPVNIKVTTGEIQGDWSMIGIGPYDEWAIEYGYTMASDLKPILARVNEPELVYGTDEETGGPDPRSRRYDFSKNPLDYAEEQVRLIQKERARILEKFVQSGESWARARYAYELTLSMQLRSVSMMANWLGGAFTSRSLKGDKEAPKPVEVVGVDQQRKALEFVIRNSLFDDSYGLSPELINHLGVDKWLDEDATRAFSEEATYPIHDTVMGIQASALSMVMNATTLRRIYDNEVRIPADQDALTLPELLSSLTDAIWKEIESAPDKQYTSRVPLVSSLRRNLQEEHLDRLIDLSIPGSNTRTEAYKPIANQATFELKKIQSRIKSVKEKGADKLDPYTLAHLDKLAEQIEKRLAAEFIYNAKDVGGGGLGGFIIFQNEGAAAGTSTPDVTLPNPGE